MHRNVTNCEYKRLMLNIDLTLPLVVCLSPGNVEMAPGRRVAQLLNIAFDMAAWVSQIAIEITFNVQ